MKQSSLDEPNLEYDSSKGVLIKNDNGMDTSEGDVDEGVFVNQPLLGSYQNYYENPNNEPETRPDTPPPSKPKGTVIYVIEKLLFLLMFYYFIVLYYLFLY